MADGNSGQQKRGTIPTMDDRDRITAGEVNPHMNRANNSDGRGGDVQAIGKFGGNGAEEAADYSPPIGAPEGSAAAGEVGVDTGNDTILYGNDVDENPNGSGRTGVKDDRS